MCCSGGSTRQCHHRMTSGSFVPSWGTWPGYLLVRLGRPFSLRCAGACCLGFPVRWGLPVLKVSTSRVRWDCRRLLSRRPSCDLDRRWVFSQLLGVFLAGVSSRACPFASRRTLDTSVFWGLSTNVLVRNEEGASPVSRSSAVSRTASVRASSAVRVPMPLSARMGLQCAVSHLVSVASTGVTLCGCSFQCS